MKPELTVIKKDDAIERVTLAWKPSDLIAHAHQFGEIFSGQVPTEAKTLEELLEAFQPAGVERLGFDTPAPLLVMAFRDRSGAFIRFSNKMAECLAMEPDDFAFAYGAFTVEKTWGAVVRANERLRGIRAAQKPQVFN